MIKLQMTRLKLHLMDLSDTLAIGQILIWIGAIAYYIFAYKNKIDNIESKLNKIDISLEVTISKVNSIERGLKSARDCIRDLSGYLTEWKIIPNHLQNFDTYYNSNSPPQLTKRGINFIEESGFKAVFENNKEHFIKPLKERLKSKKEDDAFFYFCEEYSIQFTQELEENESELLSGVRGYIFKEGLYDLKETLFKVLGLYLRDHVIAAFNKATEFKQLKAKKRETNQ